MKVLKMRVWSLPHFLYKGCEKMTMEYKSNYEKVTEDWKKRFLDMDQERLIERFQLNHDGQWLYLRYLGQQLKLSRTSGKVLFADREEIPEFDTVITVYNMFYYAKEHPAASGELVPFSPGETGVSF